MICPKCSRDIENDKTTCGYCGFTFLTPQNRSTPVYTEPPVDNAPNNSTPVKKSPAEDVPYTNPHQKITPVYKPHFDYNEFKYEEKSTSVSIMQYIGMILLGFIPVVGFIFFLVLVCKKRINENIKHFAVAVLLLKGIFLVFILGATVVYIIVNVPIFYYLY